MFLLTVQVEIQARLCMWREEADETPPTAGTGTSMGKKSPKMFQKCPTTLKKEKTKKEEFNVKIKIYLIKI